MVCVQINGKPVKGPSADHIFVFQHSGLFPWMTVAENVGLGLRHLKNRRDRHEQVIGIYRDGGTGRL
jgi:ABC-type taurine transport system ATPase subunit